MRESKARLPRCSFLLEVAQRLGVGGPLRVSSASAASSVSASAGRGRGRCRLGDGVSSAEPFERG